MPKAVRYHEFGGVDVLQVVEVERPVPADGQVLVRVKATGIKTSEAAIRVGAVANIFPSTFPSGQGSDLAGVIEEVGRNLIAAGDAQIECQTETYNVTIGELTGAERDRVYAEQARRYPGFAEYERQTAGVRTIPVLELRRAWPLVPTHFEEIEAQRLDLREDAE
jgi:NADPH:quinone reductase-like Zn-dependent oxidoreductase